MCKMLELAVFLLCLLPMTSAGGLADKVLLFPQKTDDSYVKITPEKPLNLTAFTLCMRVATEQQGQRDMFVFSYRIPDMNDLRVWIEKDKTIALYISRANSRVYFNLPPLSNFLTHLCFTWSSLTGHTAAWMNGQRSIYRKYGIGCAVRPGGAVVLGQNPYELLGGFDAEQSFVGEITDVNLWDEVLPAKEIKGVYANTATVKMPNVINWRTAEYDKQGIVEVIQEDF
ncbi:C-reactive protein-like isoform X1 [Misgurnus anguillicaudatus]|uniref:C-reactive protein-like isoform X1 n=1 Tax=Misgurnus anguillicaudatus TaxID=75329 RepID=UPI003CCF336F